MVDHTGAEVDGDMILYLLAKDRQEESFRRWRYWHSNDKYGNKNKLAKRVYLLIVQKWVIVCNGGAKAKEQHIG